jgi:carboxymethylenebutenolidase
MCLGGHLAFRCAFDKRIRAAVCYFATDIHSHTLGQGKNDDSLDRVKDITGELIMVRIAQPKLTPPSWSLHD